jgi:Zn2+/Cd2+-exporting ATPase
MPAIETCAVCELHAEAVFRVEGMDCSEEVTILERRLKPLIGLEAVSADLMNQRLHVKYDAARLTTSAMVDAVGQTGMRMWLEHDEPAAYGGGIEWRWRVVLGAGVAVLIGGALTLAGLPEFASWLFIAAAVVGGIYPARRALTSLQSRTVDINVLMVIAVAGALLLGDWLEAASVVLLFAIAQWLEVRTLDRARQAIRALIDLSPPEATVVRGGTDVRVKVEDLVLGDRVAVRPGDKLPIDGIVCGGDSDVNEAPITGESLPIDKSIGDQVFAGTINGRGALEVEVTRLRRDTRLARIIHLVETAQAQRAPVQTFVERFARVYTPAVIAIALIVAFVPFIAGAPDPLVWVYRALVLLVIACPCALVISTPVSVVAALAGAAKHGVLIKGAHLERLAAVTTVAFDKTGTLTHGDLRVASVVALDDMSQRQVLAIAARVEARSDHPIARAITKHAMGQGSFVVPASGVSEVPGMGAEGTVDGRRVLVGNARLLETRGISPAAAANTGSPRARGGTLVYVAMDDRPIGMILIADRPRAAAREAIELLRRHVAYIVMLTGDHVDAADAVAAELGIDETHASLLPDQKHAMMASLRSTHGPVMMVGDGINDAPALAAADVGVAMGAAASDAALETADVALMSDELLKLPYALRLARAAIRNIRTNIAISLVMKAAFLLMAVTGAATLWMAILADTGASVLVVVNALRLLRAK